MQTYLQLESPGLGEAFAENLVSNLAWFVSCCLFSRASSRWTRMRVRRRSTWRACRVTATRTPRTSTSRRRRKRGGGVSEWQPESDEGWMQGWWEKERKEEACCAIRRRWWRKINLPPWMIYPWRRDRDLFKNLAIFEQARAIEIWDRVGSQIPMRSENCAGNFPVLEKPAAALTRSPFVLRRHPTVSHMSFHSKSTLRARNREGWRCVVSGLYKILISRHLELVYFVRPPI